MVDHENMATKRSDGRSLRDTSQDHADQYGLEAQLERIARMNESGWEELVGSEMHLHRRRYCDQTAVLHQEIDPDADLEGDLRSSSTEGPAGDQVATYY